MFVFLMEMCFFEVDNFDSFNDGFIFSGWCFVDVLQCSFFLTGYAKEPPDRPCDHFLRRHLHTVTLSFLEK